jgi:hypothetical protein
MDPVDVLTMAAHAAQLIRSGHDPQKIIAGAYMALNVPSPRDGDDSLAVRIARLTEAADEKRETLMQYLTKRSGPLPLNRPAKGWGGAVEAAAATEATDDTEANALLEYAETERRSARDMTGDLPSFSVAEKRVSCWFGGRTVVTRNGKRLSQEQAGEIQVGDSFQFAKEGLPSTVRVLIDYPLERACLFTIHAGDEPWSVWDICCSIADQYRRIYEEPEKYGVWGHDLTDLWIERLLYFPDKQLIYPRTGS